MNDALFYSFLVKELDILVGGKIDKVFMPQKDEIVLKIYVKGNNYFLLASACPSGPHICLSSRPTDNPQFSPAFLMHLRKHIGGGIITAINQLPFERVVIVEISATNELLERQNYRLIVEIMGKYSNVILCKGERISEAIKHVPPDMSVKRQILPGMIYEIPPAQNKLSVFDENAVNALENCAEIDRTSVLARFFGLAPDSIAEGLFRAEADGGLTPKNIVEKLRGLYSDNRPCILVKEGVKTSFMPSPYLSLGNDFVFFDSANACMDEYFGDTGKKAHFSDKSSRLAGTLKNAIKRSQKKLAAFMQKQLECSDLDGDKLFGELITAYMYSILPGQAEVKLLNYYDNTEVIVPLPKRTAQENAQFFFKRYAKKKKTLEMLSEQIQKTRDELDAYESAETAFDFCSTDAELADIALELSNLKLIPPQKQAKNRVVSSPHKFIFDGFTVFVGKNNIQNDKLTREASGSDVWLHTKNIHGCHVIIKNPDYSFPPDDVLLRAAQTAAYFSKAKNSGKTDVDYTFKKFVKKPSGSAAGKVVYTDYFTLSVQPRSPYEK